MSKKRQFTPNNYRIDSRITVSPCCGMPIETGGDVPGNALYRCSDCDQEWIIENVEGEEDE